MSQSKSKRGRAAMASGADGVTGASGADGIPPRAPAPGRFPPFGTHAAAQWLPHASFLQQSPTTSDWMYSQGGFMNMLQSPMVPGMSYPNGSQQPQNCHLVGGIMSHSTTSPTSACSKGTQSPTESSADAAVQIGLEDKETIEVEDSDTIQPARSNARLTWSNAEDIRLVSAWLHNSIDPIDGNDKKAEKYWSDVTSTYNSTTKCDRMRNRNQLKLRWERIKKPVSEFNGCYNRITKVHQSGMSDDQKMDKAMQLYASEHSDKPFTMVHVWRILRHEKKWSSYVKRLSNEKDKSVSPNPGNVVDVEAAAPKQRPIGHKKAKDERNGKRKEPEVMSAIGEKLDKFIEASTKAEKMAEVQESLADKKLEVAKINQKTAEEQTKAKMLDLYRELLCATTSNLTEEAKAERSKALESMTVALFSKDN